METRLMTRADHLAIETEGALTPAQAANNDIARPSQIDLQIANCETLLVRKLVVNYLRKIDERIAHIAAGRITPMPVLQDGLPAYLQIPKV